MAKGRHFIHIYNGKGECITCLQQEKEKEMNHIHLTIWIAVDWKARYIHRLCRTEEEAKSLARRNDDLSIVKRYLCDTCQGRNER